MGTLITRIVLMAGGLGATEIGLIVGSGPGGFAGWLLVGAGLILLVAGSAGFMGPLFGAGGRGDEG